ncbi:hypothetical protein LAZ67_14000974 [Cordylochernes scorpioides]|uniref:Uncharacterized protein n=1 Tax=Cordylochernes scorpioides TaxID=51811 RepID=A0ABY6L5T4_9ARAC|nr:hypothetical protein LAZ67_14000974 [Cordylochernes scorpioides]
METSEALHWTRQQQQYSIRTQDKGHSDCCDRDAWRHLRLFIGHDNNRKTSSKAAALHTQDSEHCCCCDRDVWTYLRLFFGHDNNNNPVYTPKIEDIETAVIEMHGDI